MNWMLPILLVVLAACEGGLATTPNATSTDATPNGQQESVPADRLEFLQERVLEVQKGKADEFFVGLERSSRWFVIDDRFTADPKDLVKRAREAVAARQVMHITVYDPDPTPKSPANRGKAPSSRILRIAETPDPRKR